MVASIVGSRRVACTGGQPAAWLSLSCHVAVRAYGTAILPVNNGTWLNSGNAVHKPTTVSLAQQQISFGSLSHGGNALSLSRLWFKRSAMLVNVYICRCRIYLSRLHDVISYWKILSERKIDILFSSNSYANGDAVAKGLSLHGSGQQAWVGQGNFSKLATRVFVWTMQLNGLDTYLSVKIV